MWPSTDIINSRKHIIHEIKELNYNIYTYIHKRQAHILKMQFHLKYRGRANGLICPSMLYCRMRFAMCSSQICNNHFLSTFFAILHFMTSDLSMARQA